ncbi:hypothetical protein GH741_19935 [Aquibacillus halophilus]|uniref:Uncharacterized protein n=1 Tax=Aquibacillus halophilus TaxID=930132 RepID=A0A6A8DPE7_9BACI|nr:hypothetical protein [Aquibacillus halophilus]MRH44917.1 hypothetical protein [Aquibacillus halophilus]
MINQDFDGFIKNQEKEKTNYLGHGERGKNIDPKTNNRKNSNKNVGATGKNLE